MGLTRAQHMYVHRETRFQEQRLAHIFSQLYGHFWRQHAVWLLPRSRAGKHKWHLWEQILHSSQWKVPSIIFDEIWWCPRWDFPALSGAWINQLFCTCFLLFLRIASCLIKLQHTPCNVKLFFGATVKGKTNTSAFKVYSSLAEAREHTWWADGYPDLLQRRIKHMTPRPTVVVLSQKPWVYPRKSTILRDLPAALRAALRVVDTVVWLEGMPNRDEAKKKINESPVDALVRDVLCNSQHKDSVQVAMSKQNVSRTCIFVPFPSDVLANIFTSQDSDEFYADVYHMAVADVYLRRNEEVLLAAGVTHHLDA